MIKNFILLFCFQWAAFLRTHVRKQEGLRPLFELLTVEQEYVVRAVALCLRNLSLEDRNKQLTGENESFHALKNT